PKAQPWLHAALRARADSTPAPLASVTATRSRNDDSAWRNERRRSTARERSDSVGTQAPMAAPTSAAVAGTTTGRPTPPIHISAAIAGTKAAPPIAVATVAVTWSSM